MTTQESGTHTVAVINGPGSELIILSLHCLVRNEKPPLVSFDVAGSGTLQLVVTGVCIIEGVEGASITLTAAFPKDARRFCPARQKEREAREFVFSHYNHHTRRGFLQIPAFYLDEMKWWEDRPLG